MLIKKNKISKFTCNFCKSEDIMRELDDVGYGPNRFVLQEDLKKSILPVATCDHPVINTPIKYEMCGKAMCKNHIGSEPQIGFHRCPNHAATT